MRLTVLHPKAALARRDKLKVDIVAVHGLNGNATRTWTDPKSKKLWLQDFLPADIEGARVMTFDYNADTAFKTSADIVDYAGGLLRRLANHREEEGETARPIIFIVHSLGGIIVKQALVLAHAEAQYRSIKDHTVGIFFFATPHGGSKFANYGKVLGDLATALTNRPSSKLLDTLRSDSHILTTLTKDFSALIPDFQIATFYELRPMSGFSSPASIVEKESAILKVKDEDPQGVDADHHNICKFGSQEDETYETLIKRLRFMLPTEAVIHATREALNSFQHPESYNKFYEVPHNVSSIFTGRDDISGKLRAKCLPTESAITQKEHKIFVLHGLGGIGKTQICLSFAQHHRESFWGIFFVDVSSMSTAEHSFSELARSCQVGDGAEAFKRWLASSTEHWLLVLDNADDTSLDIATLFPKGARGAIILTTRNPDCIVHNTVGSASVDKMDFDEATTLLLKASGADENDQSSRGRAQPVIQLLGYLPLAIIQAGAAIRQELYTYEEYHEAFTDRRKELLSFQNTQASADYRYTVYAAWDVSVNAIRKEARGETGSPQTASSINAANALDLLTVFGFCYHEDILEDIWQDVWEFFPRIESNRWWTSNVIRMFREDQSPKWDPLPFRQAITLLSKYSLVYRTNRRISLHPLVHSWIRDSLDDKSHLQWWTTTLAMLAMTAKPRDKEMFRRQRLLSPHLNACLKFRDFGDLLVEDDSAAARTQVLRRLSNFNWPDVDLQDRLLLAQRTVEYCEKMLDQDDPRLWGFLDSTASKANNLEQWQTTVDLLGVKVISYLDTRTLDFRYPMASLDAMQRLIKAYRYVGRTQEALELAEKVLKICKESCGEDREITLAIEETMAPIYYDFGRKEMALNMFQTVYSKMEAALGEGNTRCLRAKYSLAGMHEKMGQTQKALNMYQQILEWNKILLPEDHFDTLEAQAGLAAVYTTLGRPEDGIPLIVDALDKGERAGVLAFDMQRWKRYLTRLRAMEAEQLSQRKGQSAKIEEQTQHEGPAAAAQEQPSAVTERRPKGERGFRSGLKKIIGRK